MFLLLIGFFKITICRFLSIDLFFLYFLKNTISPAFSVGKIESALTKAVFLKLKKNKIKSKILLKIILIN